MRVSFDDIDVLQAVSYDNGAVTYLPIPRVKVDKEYFNLIVAWGKEEPSIFDLSEEEKRSRIYNKISISKFIKQLNNNEFSS